VLVTTVDSFVCGRDHSEAESDPRIIKLSTDALRTVFGSLALSASDNDDSSSFVDEIVRKLERIGDQDHHALFVSFLESLSNINDCRSRSVR
jgi:hypothetical protein